MPREMPQPKETTPADIANLGYGVATVYAGCFTPFIRSHHGVRAFTLLPASLLLILAYGEAVHSEAMTWYALAWVGMLIYRRITADPRVHSRYRGYPYVCGWLTDEFTARVGEVFVCLAVAGGFSLIDDGLSDFILGEIPALLLILWVEYAAQRARRLIVNDSQIDAEYMTRK